MKMYKLEFDVSNFDWLETSKENMKKFCQLFDGTHLKDSWEIPQAKRMNLEGERPLGDAPEFVLPTFSKKALDSLMPLMKDDVEVLPIEFEGSFLYGINVITILDNVIDYDLSEYETFDGKRIIYFDKYVFRKDVDISQNIFKVANFKRGDIFVSQKFYDTIHNCGLEGFKLKLVYEG